MGSFSRGVSRLRFPRPKSCFGIMPLSIATEFIAVSLIFNKLTGFYGVLALFTGYALSPVQLSQYLLSLLTLVALFFILPHIRKGTPFPNLAFAWIYVVDTLLSIGYTTTFAITWCLTTLEDEAATSATDADLPARGDGEYDGATDNTGDQAAQYAANMASRETATSLVLVALFNLVRLYFCFVVLAHARRVLRNYVNSPYASVPSAGNDVDEDTTAAEEGDMDKDIFAKGGQLGDGWKGTMGRAMVSVGKGYWLGRKEDEEWARNVGAKFGRSRAI
ncbi:Inositolphosphorylceramide synthase subunit Kei1-domain-containing protein [Rhypophila decipiens]|uniref:Inositolphosphorylceramide synthase subunit Kei1-domain-containing protein n=1 Tax=Rhypophila decipiens TaxID=261697 RepID=A0AAN6YJ21_9PEZI|nr:Inositolphosphorylceramide synthase subunit Kei1-domain-containing protein [Rhypophila decipiens]